MATPTVALITEGAGASSTSHTITFTQTTGDRVVIFLGFDGTARTLSSVGDSFVNLTSTSATFHILTKVLDGSEGGNMVVTIAVASKSAWLAYNIQGHAAATAPVFSTVATGTSTAPDSGSLSPAGGSAAYLWLSAFRQNGEEADDDTWCSAAPSTPGTFTGLAQKTTGTAGATTLNGSVAAAQYAATTATVDPGAFTVAQSLAWRAYTVAVYPGAAVLTATVADSVASLSESPTRGGVFGRTGADSLASLTETVTRGVVAMVRTGADSVSSLSEAATRGAILFTRAFGDTVGAISEAVVAVKSGAAAFVATCGDTIGAISESAARGATAFGRTIGDSVSSISEAIVRLGVKARSAGDSVATLTEAVARAALAKARTAGDSVASLSESVARGTASLARTAGDSVSSLAESVARATAALGRTAGDAIGAISEAVVAVKGGITAFVRSAADSISSLAESAVRGALGLVRSSADEITTLTEAAARQAAAKARTASDLIATIGDSVVAFTPMLGGVTRDQYGDPIPNCTVDCFISATNTLHATTTSDGSGAFSFNVALGVEYFLVAYSVTNVYGVTARDLVGW